MSNIGAFELTSRSKTIRSYASTFTPTCRPRGWRSGLERWPRKRKVGCSNPSRDRPKS